MNGFAWDDRGGETLSLGEKSFVEELPRRSGKKGALTPAHCVSIPVHEVLLASRWHSMLEIRS